MIPPNVFLTGASGYVGGDFLFLLSQAHPDWKISALVRDEQKAAKISTEYPNVRIVSGTLDSAAVIEEEVKNSDIVYQIADCEHTGAAIAISKGARHHTKEKPVWVIHVSGTASLIFPDVRENTYGVERTKEYNDWDGLDELLNLPDDAWHQNVEKIILCTGREDPQRIKTAIVSPPTVYGPGRGPGNRNSLQVYMLANAVLQRKKGILLGEGKNIWNQIHVHDLSDLFLALGEAAAAGGGNAEWGDKGYYLAENGEYAWGDIEREVARIAYQDGLIPSPEVTPLGDGEMPDAVAWEYGLHTWGSNSRGCSIRARTLLGWTPKQPPMTDFIADIVDCEAKKLGLA